MTDARIRVSPAPDAGIVGLGLLANETGATVTVVSFDCPAFDGVEVRNAGRADGAPGTGRTGSLTVLPGEIVEFATQGRHLAMSGPRWPLEEGQLIGVTLVFASGRRRVVPFRIVVDTRLRGRAER